MPDVTDLSTVTDDALIQELRKRCEILLIAKVRKDGAIETVIHEDQARPLETRGLADLLHEKVRGMR